MHFYDPIARLMEKGLNESLKEELNMEITLPRI